MYSDKPIKYSTSLYNGNNENIQNDINHKGNYEIYLTDTESNFVNVAGKLLGKEDIEVKEC